MATKRYLKITVEFVPDPAVPALTMPAKRIEVTDDELLIWAHLGFHGAHPGSPGVHATKIPIVNVRAVRAELIIPNA